MKKLNSIFLLTLTSLSVCALASCQNQASGKKHISLSKDTEIAHKLFEASQIENILKNHESCAYTWDEPTKEDSNKEYHYVEKDLYYREWSNGIYRLDLIPERLVVSTEWAVPAPFSVGVNLNAELTSYKPFNVDNEEDFYTPDSEIIKDIYTQDGLLHFMTEYKKEDAEDFASYYGEELGNGKVLTDYVAKADSYEPKELVIKLVKDNKEKVLFISQMEYDIETPSQVYILYSYLLRDSREFMNVKFHVNKGQDSAFDIEFDVPKYTEVNLYHDGLAGQLDGFVYFNDLECTTLTRWDRASDFERYVFTEPSQELVDKFQECLNNLQ